MVDNITYSKMQFKNKKYNNAQGVLFKIAILMSIFCITGSLKNSFFEISQKLLKTDTYNIISNERVF